MDTIIKVALGLTSVYCITNTLTNFFHEKSVKFVAGLVGAAVGGFSAFLIINSRINVLEHLWK